MSVLPYLNQLGKLNYVHFLYNYLTHPENNSITFEIDKKRMIMPLLSELQNK